MPPSWSILCRVTMRLFLHTTVHLSSKEVPIHE